MWEELKDDGSDTFSHRMKVPGGWIVRTVVKTNNPAGAGCAVEQTFVSDPTDEWSRWRTDT